jgi:hypothetical protein
MWIVYTIEQKFDKMGIAITEINSRLKAVKDHAEDMRKSSIDEYLQIRDRIDKLEGIKYRGKNNTE